MKELLLKLLTDPFGVSGRNLVTLLQMVEDEDGEEAAVEIEDKVFGIDIDGVERQVIR